MLTLRLIRWQVARSLNLDGIVRQGVYAMVGGPNYETVAELKMLKELGVDSVGMDKFNCLICFTILLRLEHEHTP